jgi:hypothetical protein
MNQSQIDDITAVVRGLISRLEAKGGEGSGNFGHAGRPGEVGGSGPGGGSSNVGDGENFTEYARWNPMDGEDDIKNDLLPKYEKWSDSLSEDEIKSLKDYTGAKYEEINKSLRSDGDITDNIKNIDSALNTSEIPHNLITYRGIDNKELYNAIKSGNLSVGDVLEDKGFVSTSPRFGVSQQFLLKKSILLKIKCYAGSKGGYLIPQKLSLTHNEHEILLPRNSKFKITKIYNKSFGDIGRRATVIEVDYGK